MKTAALPRSAAQPITLLWCVMGLLLPRATLFGELAPFGIGLAACSGAANWPVLICLSAGYLLTGNLLEPFRYLVTIGMVGGLRWVLEALPEWNRRRFVPPLVAFTCCFATGLILLSQTGLDLYRTLLILAESGVAAGSALFFDTAMGVFHAKGDYVPTAANQTAVILTGAVAVSAAATLSVGGFAPGRVAAAFLVLILARSGREAGGSIAGCVLGSALALASPGHTSLAVALAFGGLMAGLFSRFGRVAESVLFLLAAGVVTLGETDPAMLMYIAEIGVACLLFALLPQEWDRRLCRLFIRSRDLPAVEGVRRLTTMQLRVASGAMEEVAHSVDAVSRRLSVIPDPSAIYRGCFTAVCAACPMRGLCWEGHGEAMRAGLEQLTPFLRETGRITPDQLVGHPAACCRRKERLTDYINGEYRQFLAREGAFLRLREIQQAVEGQFSGTGELLRGLAARLEDPDLVDVELSGRVLAVCEDDGMAVQDALCTRDSGNRLTVDILTRDSGAPPGRRWHRRMEQVCGRTFAPPVEAAWGDNVRITLVEPPRYRVERAVVSRRCAGEKLCGDTVQVQELTGAVMAVLSDGMGCGGQAAVDSAMAAGITTRLWAAGFSPNAVLQMVNAALQVKSGEESLSTLDVAVVDTHTGRLDSYKAGAAVTLLRSQGRVSRLDRPGLPVGILPEGRFEHSHDLLAEEDILLMVSDGALAAGVAAVEQCLAQHPEGENLQTLCEGVCDLARAAEGAHSDDITAVAMRIIRS